MTDEKKGRRVVATRDDDTDNIARAEDKELLRRLENSPHPAIKPSRVIATRDETDDEEMRRIIRCRERDATRLTDLIVRPTLVDTSLSSREIINRFGDRQIIEPGLEACLNDKEREPERELKEMMVHFFWVARFKSFRDIAQQYVDRGLVPHLRAVGTVNISDPWFAYDYSNNVWMPGGGMASFIHYKMYHEVFITTGWTFLRKGRRVDVSDFSWWGGVPLDSIL